MSMAGRFAAGWLSEHFPRPHHILAVCLLMQAAGTGFLMSLDLLGAWSLVLFVPLVWSGLRRDDCAVAADRWA